MKEGTSVHAIHCRETACNSLTLGIDEVEYESFIDIYFKQSICIDDRHVDTALGTNPGGLDAASCLRMCNESGQAIALLSPSNCTCGNRDMIDKSMKIKDYSACEVCEGQPGEGLILCSFIILVFEILFLLQEIQKIHFIAVSKMILGKLS